MRGSLNIEEKQSLLLCSTHVMSNSQSLPYLQWSSQQTSSPAPSNPSHETLSTCNHSCTYIAAPISRIPFISDNGYTRPQRLLLAPHRTPHIAHERLNHSQFFITRILCDFLFSFIFIHEVFKPLLLLIILQETPLKPTR